MLVSDLEIGQNVTVEYWFTRPQSGDDFSIITGDVIKKNNSTAAIKVSECLFGWFTGYTIWIGEHAKIISINN